MIGGMAHHHPVILAQAGIQKHDGRDLSETLARMDSRLRGNDEQ